MSQPNHTDEESLSAKLQNLEEIRAGDTYVHYRDSTKRYRILGKGFNESTESPVIIYQALYGKGFVWVREWSSWNSAVLLNGELTPRFRKVISTTNAPTTIHYNDIVYVATSMDTEKISEN